jgi:DNA mismatch endonuclease, patch repair protein
MASRDPAITSYIMSHVRSRDTEPEMLLRRELWTRGLRYRVRSQLPGKPDLVFTRHLLAVFVDGDFWHGHGWAARGFTSMEEQFRNHRDPDKWIAKIRRNVERDREVERRLRDAGWRVHRVLESEIRADVASAADGVARLLEGGPPHRRTS